MTLDGASAFDVVSRDILARELYCTASVKGQFWLADKTEYENTMTKIKLNKKISCELVETLGVKQGNTKSSDYYKIYNKYLLDTVEAASLGVEIGPLNVGFSCCADDFLGMSDNPHKLQCIIDIAEYYGEKYEVSYGSDKTKVVVYGSKVDEQFYFDLCPWKMNNSSLSVVNENKHLGQIISNSDEYQKNIDLNISKARKSLFSLFGPTMSQSCQLNPSLKLHILKTYVFPIEDKSKKKS